jgi:hypothetical protein
MVLFKSERGNRMQQRKMIEIPIGTEVRSSVRAPIDGDYVFVEHAKPTDCEPSGEQAKTYRLRGELVPLCKTCGKRAIWSLVQSNSDISPEKDQTSWVLKEVRGDRPDVAYPSGSKE